MLVETVANRGGDTAAQESLRAENPLVAHAVSAIARTSRSFNGVADISVSEKKMELCAEGLDLVHIARANVSTALQYLFGRRYVLDTAADVERLVMRVADMVNDGLVDSRQGKFRQWDAQHMGYPPAAEIPALLKDFYHDFYIRMRAEDNPVRFAAWVEQHFNHGIHPLSDGVGRVSAVLGAWILGEHGLSCPVHADGATCFERMNRPFPEWFKYYGSLVAAKAP